MKRAENVNMKKKILFLMQYYNKRQILTSVNIEDEFK